MSTMAAFGSALSRIFDRAETTTGEAHGAQSVVLDLLDRTVRDARLGIQVGGRSFTVGQGTGELLATLRLREAPRARTGRSKADNVQRHYDAGDELFAAFLDPTMTYSCGYMASPDDSLEKMQRNKFERICRKLELRPGDRLLDIGCGFGGLLIHAATHHCAHGVGVTNSRRHCARGQENVARAGLADRIEIRSDDFTRVTERFDRVVSVGMMEHVPRREYAAYFAAIARVLAPDERGLVHTIGCAGSTNDHDPFIQKYIFPGSGQPRLSEIAGGLERERLAILDVENIVRHHGHTILRWLANFRRNRGSLDPARHDDRLCRMFEYYFHCGIAAAFAAESAVFQVLFAADAAAPMRLHRV